MTVPALATSPNSGVPAAGIALIDPRRHVLFVNRSHEVDHPGSWCFPGGGLEKGETPVECAIRETKEETGRDCALDDLYHLDRRELEGSGVDYTTYCALCDQFRPELSGESAGYVWAPWGQWPQPLHPGVQATLEAAQEQLEEAEDVELKRNPDGSYQPAVNLGEILPYTTKVLKEDGQPYDGSAPEKRTGSEAADAEMAMDPLTEKGRKILGSMKKQYGSERGESIFYASKNKGTISGVDADLSERFELTADLAHLRDKLTGRLYPVSALTARDSIYKPSRFASDRQFHMALDRSSVRAYDNDGRLHVENAHVSKAAVNPYYGREIPNYEQLGLRPDRKYMLLRDPEELQRGAKTFNNLPVLDRHVPVTSDTSDSHQPALVIGSTGTDARYKHPFMDNSLVIWAKPAIDDVEGDVRRELSCAYRYDADMTPGTYEGQHYDGVMRNIRGNHIALVKDGRAGHDVVIGDEAPDAAWGDSKWVGAVSTAERPFKATRFNGAQDTVASDMSPDEWREFRRLLAKFLSEEAAEPEHDDKAAKDAGTHEGAVKAAATRKARGGLASPMVAKGKPGLQIQRSNWGDDPVSHHTRASGMHHEMYGAATMAGNKSLANHHYKAYKLHLAAIHDPSKRAAAQRMTERPPRE